MDRLHGMRVIVTGAASGIGRATADLLAERGARLLLSDLKAEAIREVSAAIGAKGHAQVASAACNVRDEADCERLVAAAIEAYEGIDALVHCAGILRPPGSRPAPLFDLDESEYDVVVGTNLRGTFLVNRAVLRRLVAQKSGQIINISSTSGKKGRPLDSLYSASKAGVIALSESIAEEVRPFNVRVQVLLPDAVDTPLWDQNGPLVAAPAGSLSAQRVGEVIALCLSLPEDMVLDQLAIMPFRLRKARQRGSAKED